MPLPSNVTPDPEQPTRPPRPEDVQEIEFPRPPDELMGTTPQQPFVNTDPNVQVPLSFEERTAEFARVTDLPSAEDFQQQFLGMPQPALSPEDEQIQQQQLDDTITAAAGNEWRPDTFMTNPPSLPFLKFKTLAERRQFFDGASGAFLKSIDINSDTSLFERAFGDIPERTAKLLAGGVLKGVSGIIETVHQFQLERDWSKGSFRYMEWRRSPIIRDLTKEQQDRAWDMKVADEKANYKPYLEAQYLNDLLDDNPSLLPDPDSTLESVIFSAPHMIGTMALAATGNVMPAIGLTYSIESQSIFDDMRAKGASYDDAKLGGDIGGTINASLEMLNINGFLKWGRKAAAKVATKKATEQAVTGAAKLGLKEITDAATKRAARQALSRKVAGEFLERYGPKGVQLGTPEGRSLAWNILNEMITEPTQGTVSEFTAYAVGDIPIEEGFGERRWKEMKAALLMSGIFAGGGKLLGGQRGSLSLADQPIGLGTTNVTGQSIADIQGDPIIGRQTEIVQDVDAPVIQIPDELVEIQVAIGQQENAVRRAQAARTKADTEVDFLASDAAVTEERARLDAMRRQRDEGFNEASAALAAEYDVWVNGLVDTVVKGEVFGTETDPTDIQLQVDALLKTEGRVGKFLWGLGEKYLDVSSKPYERALILFGEDSPLASLWRKFEVNAPRQTASVLRQSIMAQRNAFGGTAESEHAALKQLDQRVRLAPAEGGILGYSVQPSGDGFVFKKEVNALGITQGELSRLIAMVQDNSTRKQLLSGSDEIQADLKGFRAGKEVGGSAVAFDSRGALSRDNLPIMLTPKGLAFIEQQASGIAKQYSGFTIEQFNGMLAEQNNKVDELLGKQPRMTARETIVPRVVVTGWRQGKQALAFRPDQISIEQEAGFVAEAGELKERKGGNNVYRVENAADHLRRYTKQTAIRSGYLIPARDTLAVLQNDRMSKHLQDKIGNDRYKELLNDSRRMVQQRAINPSWTSKQVRAALGNFQQAVLGGRAKVALNQLASVPLYFHNTTVVNIAAAGDSYLRYGLKDTRELMRTYSDLAWMRSEVRDIEQLLGLGSRDSIVVPKEMGKKIKELLSKPARWTDQVAMGYGWWAAEAEIAQQRPELAQAWRDAKESGDTEAIEQTQNEYMPLVARQAEVKWVDSQPAFREQYGPKSRIYQKGIEGNPLFITGAAFATAKTIALNQLYRRGVGVRDAIRSGDRRRITLAGEKLAKTLGGTIASNITIASISIAALAIKGKLSGRKREDELGKLFAAQLARTSAGLPPWLGNMTGRFAESAVRQSLGMQTMWQEPLDDEMLIRAARGATEMVRRFQRSQEKRGRALKPGELTPNEELRRAVNSAAFLSYWANPFPGLGEALRVPLDIMAQRFIQKNVPKGRAEREERQERQERKER